jgi:ubiquinone biosynthesis protein
VGADRRGARRLDVDALVEGTRAGRRYLFRTRDLSTSGLYIYTPIGHVYPFAVGEELAVELRHRDTTLRCQVIIARVIVEGTDEAYRFPPGFGCRFVHLDDAARATLERLLDEQRARLRIGRLATALRGALVMVTVLALAVAYALGRIALVVRRGDHQALARWQGRVLRRGAATLGATTVKLGQVMSTRPDLLPPEIIAELRLLQDRMPAFALRRVRGQVERELGLPLRTCFGSFEPRPIAAASCAQVHRATLPNGHPVAVKLLRPNIRQQVERDGTILLGLARLMALRPSWRASDPVGHLAHFVHAVRAQTDLLTEAANYQRFRDNFAHADKIVFPAVYRELTCASILTMDFVDGSKIDELAPERLPALTLRARDMVLKMCFEDGFVHADLHPGNMLIGADDTLYVLDCGLAKQLHDDILLMFIDMNRCLAAGTADDLIAHFRCYHRYLPADLDWERLRDELAAIQTRHRGRSVVEIEMGQLIGDTLALMRRYRMRPTPELAIVFVAMVTIEGLYKQLRPGDDLFAAVARYLVPLLMRRPDLANPDAPPPDRARARES